MAPPTDSYYIGPQHWQHGTSFNFFLLLCTRHHSTFSLVLLPYEKNDKKTKESICLYINSCTNDQSAMCLCSGGKEVGVSEVQRMFRVAKVQVHNARGPLDSLETLLLKTNPPKPTASVR